MSGSGRGLCKPTIEIWQGGASLLYNSDFVLMLNQAPRDREILAKKLGISPYQIFEQANARIIRRNHVKKPSNYVLRSKIICGCCKHSMQIAQKKVRQFYCPFTKIDVTAECHNFSLPEQELENLLFEIINTQAQIILNNGGISDTADLPLRAEQQSEYEKRMELCDKKKCTLYERYVLGEVDAETYKAEKSIIDVELAGLRHSLNALKAEAVVMSSKKTSDDELRRLAESASSEGKLNRSLVELLIDKVYVYPGNRVEIRWKVADFART